MELRRNSKALPRILLNDLSPRIWNNSQSMKTVLCSAVIITFAIFFDHARLDAEDKQSADMRLYPAETIEWKAGPAALPPGAKMAVLEGNPTKEGSFVVRF